MKRNIEYGGNYLHVTNSPETPEERGGGILLTEMVSGGFEVRMTDGNEIMELDLDSAVRIANWLRAADLAERERAKSVPGGG
ncbi:MAG: hypothetical protein V2A79_09950 [Planctomycetota bacterium]